MNDNDRDIQDLLLGLISNAAESVECEEPDMEVPEGADETLARFSDVSTFEEAGIMTNNAGLVVSINGRQIQITIVS